MPSSSSRPDQARFGEAGRRLGHVFVRRNARDRHRLAHGDRRQPALVVRVVAVVAPGVVPAFLIDAEEAVEGDGLTGGAEPGATVVGGDIHAHPVDLGARHLARERALPDQLVEPRLILLEHGRERLGRAGEIGGADRLVGFLRVLRLGAVATGLLRHVVRAVALADHVPRLAQRLFGDLHAVGPHVGDEAHLLAVHGDAFVELLRHLHGAPRGEAQLARGFLLQGRRGEGRRRIALDPLGLDCGDAVTAGADQRGRLLGRFSVAERVLAELLAVEDGEAGDHALAPGRVEIDLDGPVFARLEGFDLELTRADQAERNGLHPACRA